MSLVDRLREDYALWARLCYRIRDKHGQIRPLVLNRVQRAIGEAERRQLRKKGACRIYALKARQGGVSTDQQGRNLHQVWSQPNFDALTLAHTSEDTAKLFEITRRAIEHFPPALLPRLGLAQTNEVSFPGLDARFFTGTAGSRRTGRGLTIRRFHGSEFAFWNDPVGTLGVVTPALVPTRSVVTLETTASGFGSDAHGFWEEAEARGYERVFFPWWDCDPENYRLPLLAPDELGPVSDEEQRLVARHGLDLEQLKWRRHTIAELGKPTFLTEYAEDAASCWAAPGGMFYDFDLLAGLQQRTPTPRETHLGGALRIYADPLPGERVIIGSDTAEGVGGDDSTWVARSFPSWRLLADFNDNRTKPDDFADMLNEWGRGYGNALLVVEKNLHGITVLRRLRDTHRYPLGKIYHRQAVDRPHEKSEPSERIGWHTSEESKPLLLNAGTQLFKAARDGVAGVPSAAVVEQGFGVRRGNDGKYDLNGRDLLVADMLCWIGRSHPVMDAGGALVTF